MVGWSTRTHVAAPLVRESARIQTTSCLLRRNLDPGNDSVMSWAETPNALIDVTSIWAGTSNSLAMASRSKARNCRADRPSACACKVMCATACPRSYCENSEYSQSGVSATRACDTLTTSRDASVAHRAELGANRGVSLRCTESSRRATMNDHGWEFPADGANLAASSSTSTWRSEIVDRASKACGLNLPASAGCSSSGPVGVEHCVTMRTSIPRRRQSSRSVCS